MIAITLPSDTAQEAYYAATGRRYLPERLDTCQVFTNTDELVNVTISRVYADQYHEYYVYAMSDDCRLWLWTGTEPIAHLVGSHGLLAADISVLPLAARLAYYDRLHAERQGA